jgi:nucleoside-diphosphate-sugar epimerase
VRDVAEAHVAAFEKPEAANKRFFTVAGLFSNREVANIIRNKFPQYKDLPSDSTPGGDYPDGGLYSANNKQSIDILGLKYKSLEESIVDTVKTLQELGL